MHFVGFSSPKELSILERWSFDTDTFDSVLKKRAGLGGAM